MAGGISCHHGFLVEGNFVGWEVSRGHVFSEHTCFLQKKDTPPTYIFLLRMDVASSSVVLQSDSARSQRSTHTTNRSGQRKDTFILSMQLYTCASSTMGDSLCHMHFEILSSRKNATVLWHGWQEVFILRDEDTRHGLWLSWSTPAVNAGFYQLLHGSIACGILKHHSNYRFCCSGGLHAVFLVKRKTLLFKHLFKKLLLPKKTGMTD